MSDDDAREAAEKAEINRLVEAADKEVLWWALHRLLGAVHCARAAANIDNNREQQAILAVVGATADHWGPQIPGMPTYEEKERQCRADDAHHRLTDLGERLGVYLTGDEFF